MYNLACSLFNQMIGWVLVDMFKFVPVFFIVELVGLILRARIFMDPFVCWGHKVARTVPPPGPGLSPEWYKLWVWDSSVGPGITRH